jgi:hypothetical protein
LTCGSIVTASLVHAADMNGRFAAPAIEASMSQFGLAAWPVAHWPPYWPPYWPTSLSSRGA